MTSVIFNMMTYINMPANSKIFTIFISLMVTGSILAQEEHQLLKKADQSYIKQDFNKAEEDYRKALELKKNQKTTFNLGNAIMEQNRPDEAINYYEDAAKKNDVKDLNARALYNLGNAYYQKKDFENSVKSYKQSLKLEPSDMDTKKNLSLATQQLIKQQQQQQQQQNKDQDKDKQPPQPQQNQDPQSGQPKEQQKDQPPQPGDPQPTSEGMTKEEAEQLLQYTEREDQRVQQKMTNKSKKNNPPKKDW